MSFKPEDTTIKDLLYTNINYIIPRYQRKYVWTEKNWNDMIEDIFRIIDNNNMNSEHFIGSFILEKCSENQIVIDGQQRLTTLTILLGIVIKLLVLMESKLSTEEIKRYCFKIDNTATPFVKLVNDEYVNILKIFLCDYIQDNNDEILSDYIKRNYLKITQKELLIENCIDYFYNIIVNKVKQSSLPSKYLESILDTILKMKCISIIADNEQEGYIIFEILNSRGVPLQMHELIKNYIFMYSRENNGFDIAKNKWDQIISNVDEKKNSSIKKFISHYCVHYFGKEKGLNEYELIKKYISKDKVNEFLDDLVKKSKLYKNLIDGNAEYSDSINYVFKFFQENQVSQFRPILLSLLESYEKGFFHIRELEKVLVTLKNFICVSVIICENKTNSYTKLIADYAYKLHNDFTKNIVEAFFDELYKNIPNEKTFTNKFMQLAYSKFAEKYNDIKLDKGKKIRLVLLENEIQNTGEYNIPKFTIEHIKNDCEGGEACYIGNLIPLTKKNNNKLGSASYEEKIIIYDKSMFTLPKEIAKELQENYKSNSEYWNDDMINKRTKKLIKKFYNEIWIRKFS